MSTISSHFMHKPARVLHTTTWCPRGSGVDKNLLLNLTEQVKLFDTHLAVGRILEHDEFSKIPGLRVHQCPYLYRKINGVADILSVIWFYRLIRKYQFDIVHTHQTKASIITRIAAWLARTPHIIYGLHGLPFNPSIGRITRYMYLLIEKLTIWMNDCITPVGEDLIKGYHSNKVGTHVPYQVIYSGINLDEYEDVYSQRFMHRVRVRSEVGVAPDATVFINVGRFSWQKCQRDTILAFSQLDHTQGVYHLLLVGEGPEYESCKQLVIDLGLRGRVSFYGYSSRVSELFVAADVHVLTSLREGLPRVVVEASIMGVPTVAYSVEGIREVIRDTFEGIIVPSGVVEDLRKAMGSLASSEILRKKMGEKVRNAVIARWDGRRMTRDVISLYNRLLSGDVVC